MNDPDNKRFYSKVLTYFSFGLMFCALGLNLFSREGKILGPILERNVGTEKEIRNYF